jgi:hypothetical protein
VQYMPRCYKQGRYRLQLVVRQSPASNGVNMEVEEAAALGAVTRQHLVKIHQTEKT